MSRPRKTLTAFSILLLIAAAVYAGAEIWLRSYASDQVASQLQKAWLTPEKPEVKFSDKLLVPAILGRELHGVHVNARQVTLASDNKFMEVDRLQVRIPTIELRGPQRNKYYAKTLSVSGQVSANQVSEVVGFPVTFTKDRMQAAYGAELSGQKLEATISVKPKVNRERQAIDLTQPEIAVAGLKLPANMAKALIAKVIKPIKLPLPEHLNLTGASVGDGHLQVDLDGEDVMLSELASQAGR